MHKFFLALALFPALFLFPALVSGQSPYLGVSFKMEDPESTRYSITLKICDAKNVPPTCGRFFETADEEKYNEFRFGNQVAAFEKILVFRIANESTRMRVADMFIVFPVKVESFITFIKLSDVVFQSGKSVLVTQTSHQKTDSGITIQASLRNAKGVDSRIPILK
jgi:hypothetical protein